MMWTVKCSRRLQLNQSSSTPSRLLVNSFTSSRRRTYATTPYGTPAPYPSQVSKADVNGARVYCSSLLQKFDIPSFTLQTFVPPSSRDAYLAIRALNIELARIPDVVSHSTIGSMRMQFWRDNLTRTFAGTPPKEPVAILLSHALQSLKERTNGTGVSTSVMKRWATKIVDTREAHMDNRPYASLADLETYAENTYSTLLYLTLGFLPLHSLAVDHLASHIGKATGIAAVLRGLPLIAFPPAPNHHSNPGAMGGSSGGTQGRQGAVMLPLDIMAELGVREEDVLRQGPNAPGLRDAVFQVATRANDHLITAQEMLKNLQQGRDAGHDFEHEGEEGHEYSRQSGSSSQADEIKKGFGVLLQAVPTRLWLQKLEKADFDVFRSDLLVRDWKLPWKAYWAYSRQKL